MARSVAEGRRPCGAAGYTTSASNKMPRKGSRDDATDDNIMTFHAKKTMPGRLRELVQYTRTAEEREHFQRDIDKAMRASVEVFKPELEELEQARAFLRSRINKLRHGIEDAWEAAYIEIEEPCDLTDMVYKALKASGFTGNEMRFRRELPR